MNAALAIMAGLREMERTGAAVQVDVAMLDTALMLMASLMTTHLTTGWKPVQNGNEAWSASPSSGAFETADGILMLAANHDTQFRHMCHAIGRDDILQDARWDNVAERHKNWKSLRETLEETFRSKPATDWEDILAEAAVPAGRIRGLDEMLAEPQIAARGLTSEIQIDGHDTPIHVPTLSFKANGENATPDLPPRPLGADTEAVLQAVGITPEQLDALRAANVI